MIGGIGNDTYVVDDECDVVSECLWQGNDTVISYIDYTLGNHVENLVAAGDKALTLNGNNLDNVIKGMLPFLVAETLVMFLLVAFPQLVTVPARWFY